MRDDFIRIYDKSLDAATCERLCALVDASPATSRIDTDYRRCAKLELRPSDPGAMVYLSAVFDRYKRDVSHNGNLQFCTHVEVPALLRYCADDHFHLHGDNWNAESALRQVAVIVFLNDVRNGGEVLFPILDRCVSPARGRAILFPAFFTHLHRALPAIGCAKYSLVTWYCFEPRTQGHYKTLPLR